MTRRATRAAARERSAEASPRADPQLQSQEDDVDIQTPAAHKGQALEKEIAEIQGIGDSDFGDDTITEPVCGQNDQRGVAPSNHGSPLGGRRVARDHSLDSSYNKYVSIDKAFEAVNDTKLMVAGVTNALDYLESRLDKREIEDPQEGPEDGDKN